MALKKTIALPTGVSGTYFRLVGFRWDRDQREASAQFALFKDAATAATKGARPLVPIAAKLRLYREAFDAYLSPAALNAARKDVVAQLYQAARETSQAYEERAAVDPKRATDPRAHVISDFGKGVFADAQDA